MRVRTASAGGLVRSLRGVRIAERGIVSDLICQGDGRLTVAVNSEAGRGVEAGDAAGVIVEDVNVPPLPVNRDSGEPFRERRAVLQLRLDDASIGIDISV